MYGEYVVIPAGHTPHQSKSGILIDGEYNSAYLLDLFLGAIQPGIERCTTKRITRLPYM